VDPTEDVLPMVPPGGAIDEMILESPKEMSREYRSLTLPA
jgi:hypothetical protein